MIVNLVKNTWLAKYTWKIEVMYDQGVEFIGKKLENTFTGEEYGIKSKPNSPRIQR